MKGKYFKYIVYIAIAYLILWFMIRKITENKYLSFLRELGFNIAENMNFDELRTSYIYLYDFARKYSTQAGQILRATNPELYNKAVIISQKYKIFNL